MKSQHSIRYDLPASGDRGVKVPFEGRRGVWCSGWWGDYGPCEDWDPVDPARRILKQLNRDGEVIGPRLQKGVLTKRRRISLQLLTGLACIVQKHPLVW